MVYKDIDSFASDLSSLARKFDSANRKEVSLIESLPLIPSLRLGLNIAACDSLPLVVVIEDDSDKQREKFLYLTHLSRNDSLAGQAHYVLLKDTKEIEDLKNYKEGNFVYVLKPDNFGVTGEVVAAFQDIKTLSVVALETAFNIAQAPKKSLSDSRQHVRKGKREGITWESQLPRADGSARSTSPKDRPHLKE